MATPLAARRDDARSSLGERGIKRVRDGYASSRRKRSQLQAPGPTTTQPAAGPKGVGRKSGRPGAVTNHTQPYEFAPFLNI